MFPVRYWDIVQVDPCWYYQQAINQFDDYGDIDKAKYKEYFEGIAMEIANSKPDLNLQRQLKTYLVELDRRRNTNYVVTFPTIAELLKDVEIWLVGHEGLEPPTVDFEDRNSIQLS